MFQFYIVQLRQSCEPKSVCLYMSFQFYIVQLRLGFACDLIRVAHVSILYSSIKTCQCSVLDD